MPDGSEVLLPNLAKEIGSLISQLHTAGWTVSFAKYDAKSFGNWYVGLCHADNVIRLTKDRSQYLFSGPPPKEIEAAGLWRSFDDLGQFCNAVIKWATHLN
jgi:hypothetical protein